MTVKEQPAGFSPSIHFGIDDTIYRNDPALSFSGMKLLLESPAEYWAMSPLNPEREEVETDPLKEGKAFHMLLLEPQKFNKHYWISPVERQQPGKTPITLGKYNAWKDAIKVLRELPWYPLMFQGGYPEVAIFWRDPVSGLMMKSKHDYFTPFYTPDYKSTDTLAWSELRWKIPRYGYDIQSALYIESRIQIRNALLNDMAVIYGTVDPSFLKAFLKADSDSFALVFQKKKKPYGVAPGPLDEGFIADGWRSIRQATDIYIRHIKKYGAFQWPVNDGRIQEFSRYNRDNGY